MKTFTDYKWKLDKLYQIAKDVRLTDYDKRHLDIAFNAVNSKELDHVIENTHSKSVQDYAIFKLNNFKSKGL